mmetsp:Transcript_18414/g.52842  ORF Transcript_18414/g.52842 Transcript_18414/m.52842 type:complete len:594 (+) Transcript_18414:153-1934(+)
MLASCRDWPQRAITGPLKRRRSILEGLDVHAGALEQGPAAAVGGRGGEPDLGEGAHGRRSADGARVHNEPAVDELPRGRARGRREDEDLGDIAVGEVQSCRARLGHHGRIPREHGEEAPLLEEEAKGPLDAPLLGPHDEAGAHQGAQRIRRRHRDSEALDTQMRGVRKELGAQAAQLLGALLAEHRAEAQVQRRLGQRVEAQDLVEGGQDEDLGRGARALDAREALAEQGQHVLGVDLFEAADIARLSAGKHRLAGDDAEVPRIDEGSENEHHLRPRARGVFEGILQRGVIEAVAAAERAGQDQCVQQASAAGRREGWRHRHRQARDEVPGVKRAVGCAAPAEHGDDLAREGSQRRAGGHVQLHAGLAAVASRALEEHGAVVQPAFEAFTNDAAHKDDLRLRRQADAAEHDGLQLWVARADGLEQVRLGLRHPRFPVRRLVLQGLVHPCVCALPRARPKGLVAEHLHRHPLRQGGSGLGRSGALGDGDRVVHRGLHGDLPTFLVHLGGHRLAQQRIPPSVLQALRVRRDGLRGLRRDAQGRAHPAGQGGRRRGLRPLHEGQRALVDFRLARGAARRRGILLDLLLQVGLESRD